MHPGGRAKLMQTRPALAALREMASPDRATLRAGFASPNIVRHSPSSFGFIWMKGQSKMKRNVLKLAGIGVLAAGLGFGQTPAPQDPQVQPQARQRVAVALNLTKEQRKGAKSIFGDARTSAKPLVEQARQNRQALTAAVKANDTGQIQQLTTAEGQLRGQILSIRSEAIAKFYTTLTPEQKAKADQIGLRFKQGLKRHAG
jgi:Spy/CpxP family protein refolding chaperone